MVGISSVKGVRVTARRIVEAALTGSGYCCTDCGAELTREEISLAYQLKTSWPRCSRCGGHDLDVAAAYPSAEGMQAQESFKAWRMTERATELLH